MSSGHPLAVQTATLEIGRTRFVNDGELASELETLVDLGAPPVRGSIDLAGAGTFDQAEDRLRRYFDDNGSQSVTVVVGDHPVGVVTRRSLGFADGTASDVGAGERLELPGGSTRYRLLRFTCGSGHPPAYRMHYDVDDRPSCEHGPMELQR